VTDKKGLRRFDLECLLYAVHIILILRGAAIRFLSKIPIKDPPEIFRKKIVDHIMIHCTPEVNPGGWSTGYKIIRNDIPGGNIPGILDTVRVAISFSILNLYFVYTENAHAITDMSQSTKIL